MSTRRILSRAVIACFLLTSHTLLVPQAFLASQTLLASQAWAFDSALYAPVDLDFAIRRERRPAGTFNLAKPGIELVASQKLRFAAQLAQLPQACHNGLLKTAMAMAGLPQNLVDTAPDAKCVRIRSADGQTVAMYIRDAMADSLSREIAVGGRLVVFADLVFVEPNGPGFLVNAFEAAR